MQHELAVRTLAVERYFLNEITVRQREEFEEHYFSCDECAEEVRLTEQFVEDMRLALTPARTAPPAPWLSSLLARVAIQSVAGVLAVLAVYQNAVTIPALRAPQSMAPAIIFDGPARGPILRVGVGAPLRLQAPIHAGGEGRVRIELTDASGKVVRSGSVESPEPNQPLDVYVPGRLNPGRYTLLVRAESADRSGPELIRERFEIVPGEERK